MEEPHGVACGTRVGWAHTASLCGSAIFPAAPCVHQPRSSSDFIASDFLELSPAHPQRGARVGLEVPALQSLDPSDAQPCSEPVSGSCAKTTHGVNSHVTRKDFSDS